jgi:hypothetical protein
MNTKRPIISQKSKEETENLPTTVDLYNNLKKEIEEEERLLERKKINFIAEVVNNSDKLENEIKLKNKINEEKRILLIEEIFKISKEKYYSIVELNNMDLMELQAAILIVKNKMKPWYVKLIEFLFG